MKPLLEVDDLEVIFDLRGSEIHAVNGVTFSVEPGEIVALVGESGCGKSVTTQCIMRLLPNPGRITGGDVRFRGTSLLTLSREEMRQVRGREISLVVQDALAALNPVTTVGEQVADIVEDHLGAKHRDAVSRAAEMFGMVGMPSPTMQVKRFPHELSGGMQQRTLIAGALVLSPSLIIADEPTTALDVTIQAQILELLRDTNRESGSAIIYVTHDLATVAELCSRVIVMYAGEVVEVASVEELLTRPVHPYTQGLLASVPPLGGERPEFLHAVEGAPPDPASLPVGCRFEPRCELAKSLGSPEACRSDRPDLLPVRPKHEVRCHFPAESEDLRGNDESV